MDDMENIDFENMDMEAFKEMQKKEIEEMFMKINYQPTKETTIEKKKRKVRRSDSYSARVTIPQEPRKSARIAKVAPSFSYADLEKVETDLEEPSRRKKRNKSIDAEYLLEENESKQRRNQTSSNKSFASVIIPVEDITDEDIAKIAKSSTNKVYTQTGTSCHQCRQKTQDTKTNCRSGRCIGVRGQFCGPCLRNRYGEDAAAALKNPDWKCPPCRDICNCSFCRAREGKNPTGILAPKVQDLGYSSVHEYLTAYKDVLKDVEKRSYHSDDSDKENEEEINENVKPNNKIMIKWTIGKKKSIANASGKLKENIEPTEQQTSEEDSEEDLLGFYRNKAITVKLYNEKFK